VSAGEPTASVRFVASAAAQSMAATSSMRQGANANAPKCRAGDTESRLPNAQHIAATSAKASE
jgi:hypothetical protein